MTDRNAVEPIEVGAHLLRAIYKRHAKDWKWATSHMDRLAGDDRLRLAVEKEGGIEALLPTLPQESAAFKAQSSKYWIYR